MIRGFELRVSPIATITNISAVAKHGVRPVTYSFQVGSIEYEIKRDTPELFINQMVKTGHVPVIYDPANPNSCEFIYGSDKDEAVVEAVAVPDGPQSLWQSLASRPIPNLVLGVVACGSFLLIALALKAVGADGKAYGATIIVTALLITVAVRIGWMLLGDRVLGRPDALFLRSRRWDRIAFIILLLAVPATIVWTKHDQGDELEARRKHDEEDLQNYRMMNPLRSQPSPTAPTATP